MLLTLMDVESAWRPDKTREAEAVFGTLEASPDEAAHALVLKLEAMDLIRK